MRKIINIKTKVMATIIEILFITCGIVIMIISFSKNPEMILVQLFGLLIFSLLLPKIVWVPITMFAFFLDAKVTIGEEIKIDENHHEIKESSPTEKVLLDALALDLVFGIILLFVSPIGDYLWW